MPSKVDHFKGKTNLDIATLLKKSHYSYTFYSLSLEHMGKGMTRKGLVLLSMRIF